MCVYAYVCASTLAGSSSALTVPSAVIQSLIAPRRVWTVIHWVVSADWRHSQRAANAREVVR